MNSRADLRKWESMSDECPILPHGARGIEIEDLVIEVGKDKIVMLQKSAGDHYTLQAGYQSGIIDLHRTWRDADGREHHETLFAMRRDDLVPLLNAFATWPQGLFRLLRPLRVGWLHRHGIAIVHGLVPTTDDELAAVTRKRRRRLVVDEKQWNANITIPEYLDAVRDFPDGAFSLFVGAHNIGIGFKHTDATGNVHLFWLRLRDITRLATAWEHQLITALQRHAIPPEQFKEHRALQQ
jgi:hypothetical protein